MIVRLLSISLILLFGNKVRDWEIPDKNSLSHAGRIDFDLDIGNVLGVNRREGEHPLSMVILSVLVNELPVVCMPDAAITVANRCDMSEIQGRDSALVGIDVEDKVQASGFL